ncbi:MAG: tRNA uridine-5-carboxymethylaminomethyl(34) synthesis GTPase MnmE [Pseudomonadota bacterium]
MDTIFAMSTAPGKAGVAVLRLSGPLAHDVTEAFSGALPAPRELRLRRLVDRKGSLIDEAMVAVFSEGASFTGESSAEWHLHGSIAVQRAALASLSEEAGLRPAEAGEFTRRALLNGRLDIGQIEGLGDLIEAETEAQRKRALGALDGRMRDRVDTLRTRLVRALALLETTIDFADEEVPEDLSSDVLADIHAVQDLLAEELQSSAAAERVRVGYEVALVGAPNAGKSTLLNYLAGRDAAITSNIAGTTRDVIEVRMDIDGLPVTFLDTAGLREAQDEVEAIGIGRSRTRIDAADLRVLLADDEPATGIDLRPGDILVAGKADLSGAKDGVSGVTGQGVHELMVRVSKELGTRVASAGVFDRERHRVAAKYAFGALDAAKDALSDGAPTEIAAEEIRAAVLALDKLIGRVGVEDVLDEVFARFCIGK